MLMKIFNKKKSGMAIFIILGLSVILAIVGGAYLKSFVDLSSEQTVSLDRLQADYFARGIQNIVLFKINKYPDFFIRSYKLQKYKERLDAGEVTQELLKTYPDPAPFTSFLTDGVKFGEGGILINWDNADFKSPLTNIASYSTDIRIVSSKDFDKNYIEVVVYVNSKIGKRNITTPYTVTIEATQEIKKKNAGT